MRFVIKRAHFLKKGRNKNERALNCLPIKQYFVNFKHKNIKIRHAELAETVSLSLLLKKGRLLGYETKSFIVYNIYKLNKLLQGSKVVFLLIW